MPDADKIRHILKGIEDDAFQMLVARNPTTVSVVIALCQSYDELRRQRVVTRHPPSEFAPVSGLTLGVDESPLMHQIKEFVREEVARQLSLVPFTNAQPHSPLTRGLQTVIKEQVAECLPAAIPPPTVAAPLTYADVAARPPFAPRPPLQAVARPPPIPFSPPAPQLPRQPNPWRTADNRPICYHCGIPGHVARFCRRLMQPTYDYRRPMNSYAPRQLQSPVPPDETPVPYTTRRSPSPRRRSISPMRRRPSPLPQGN